MGPKRLLGTIYESAIRGIKNPQNIPPFLRNRIQSFPPRPHDYWYQLHYDSQSTKLNKFREDEEWALIVLDACRHDRFSKIAPNYIDVNIEPVAAEAEDTFGYLRTCWSGEHDVDYVTGAAPVTNQEFDFSNETIEADGLTFKGEGLKNMYKGYIPSDHISNIIEVWRDAWDESLGVCPPEPVTDRAIDIAPSSQRMVVHYFQPHEPYIGETKLLGDVSSADERLEGGAIGTGIWERVHSGEISDDDLLKAYDDNLRRVLDEVTLLLETLDQHFDRIAIMGDHGEALGEYGKYTHSIPHPYVRKVPWGIIQDFSSNSGTNRYQRSNPVDRHENSVEDRLEELGYI
ncbi:hypothetical protein [Halobacterium salinarum]|uniref:hypothetical protein n=1 Tax=Halobacterium salinarum TaxID=2242 RepID=UPI002557B3A4|nr:hypothetical protein [Halobacterium salinarum]MDL0145391.1 hypothetical protein [Halobacterium salinarum]